MDLNVNQAHNLSSVMDVMVLEVQYQIKEIWFFNLFVESVKVKVLPSKILVEHVTLQELLKLEFKRLYKYQQV